MVCSRMYSQCMLKYFIQQIFLDISAKALSIKSFKSNVTTQSRANFEYVCLQYTYTLYLNFLVVNTEVFKTKLTVDVLNYDQLF